VIFLFYVTCVRAVPRLILGLANRQRVTVLLYHRVSDDSRNSLTVGLEQFERQMRDARRHSRVVSIEDIVQGKVSRRSLRPIVAVTFDDGYLDNYECAAPILLRCRVPAAFFVSTRLVDSDRGFPHDLARYGSAIPTMTWKQVEALKRWTFGVGSHTQTHINCAKDDPRAVEREIIESKRDLERVLALKDCIFAYPYGGRGDFNDAWRERVRQIGYLGCLSAYGGCNRQEIDPFNVVRTGVSHAFGRWAFRSRLEGWA
jgi:peptidoglycan/xylan/chitin deacetylase (PgdA/CDA1 family)